VVSGNAMHCVAVATRQLRRRHVDADEGQTWLHRVVAARRRSIPAAVLGDDSNVGTCDTRLICRSLIDFINFGGRRQGSVEPVAPARHHWPCFCFHGGTSRCSARMPELRGKRASRYPAATAPGRENQGSLVSCRRPSSKRRRRGSGAS
jgi:hypothetical protein